MMREDLVTKIVAEMIAELQLAGMKVTSYDVTRLVSSRTNPNRRDELTVTVRYASDKLGMRN